MKNKILYMGTFCMTALFMASCTPDDKDSPGFEFMPDMYRSSSYETNSANGNFADSLTNRMPPKGTISYDQEVTAYHPYPYPNNVAGYDSAGARLHNPFLASKEVLATGAVLYDKFCGSCHGKSGAGDGLVGGKLPGPPPAYAGALKDLSEGKMYHSVHYGKGNMGSHASQLTPDERWMILRYVQTLQGKKFDEKGVLLVQNAPADTTKKTK